MKPDKHPPANPCSRLPRAPTSGRRSQSSQLPLRLHLPAPSPTCTPEALGCDQPPPWPCCSLPLPLQRLGPARSNHRWVPKRHPETNLKARELSSELLPKGQVAGRACSAWQVAFIPRMPAVKWNTSGTFGCLPMVLGSVLQPLSVHIPADNRALEGQ